MRLLILLCLLMFAGERLYLLNWYKRGVKRAAKIGGAIQAILAMAAVVGHIWIWLGVAK